MSMPHYTPKPKTRFRRFVNSVRHWCPCTTPKRRLVPKFINGEEQPYHYYHVLHDVWNLKDDAFENQEDRNQIAWALEEERKAIDEKQKNDIKRLEKELNTREKAWQEEQDAKYKCEKEIVKLQKKIDDLQQEINKLMPKITRSAVQVNT